MKAFGKILVGCGVFAVVGVVVVVFAVLMFFGFLGNLFSNMEFTTGPPSKAPSTPDGYQVEGSTVYYTTNNNFFGNWVPNRVQLQGVDLKTFKPLKSSLLAADSKQVYYQGLAIPGADPATFRAFEDTRYSADAAHTYYDGNVIAGAGGLDAASKIEALDPNIVKSKSHVFCNGFLVKGADAATFELIGTGRVGRDKNDYYSFNFDGPVALLVPMKVHMASFKLLLPLTRLTTGGDEPWDMLEYLVWAYEDKRYYTGNKVCAIADPASFVVLPFGYAKDSKQAYYLDQVIADADLATFQIVAPDHPKNWEKNFGRYAKDAKRVYYRGKVVRDADAASFAGRDERIFMDKNRRYNQGFVTDEP